MGSWSRNGERTRSVSHFAVFAPLVEISFRPKSPPEVAPKRKPRVEFILKINFYVTYVLVASAAMYLSVKVFCDKIPGLIPNSSHIQVIKLRLQNKRTGDAVLTGGLRTAASLDADVRVNRMLAKIADLGHVPLRCSDWSAD